MMNIYQKLLDARLQLQDSELKKSGNNKFAGYKYFELGDFLPTVQRLFAVNGLCGVVSFGATVATLTITDMDKPEDQIFITSPMSTAALKGCHEVQNLGAVQTYLRRYLWVTAMEIVEHDALDASEPIKEVKVGEYPKKAGAKSGTDAWAAAPDYTKSAEVKKEQIKLQGNGGQWNIKISDDHDGNGWAKAAFDGAKMALELAQSPDDVLQIFKTNRTIFDQLQQADGAMHADLMDIFKKTKEAML